MKINIANLVKENVGDGVAGVHRILRCLNRLQYRGVFSHGMP